MLASSTLILAGLFLFTAVLTGIVGARWATGQTVSDIKFIAGIFTAFFMVSMLCIFLSWRLACPLPGKWLNMECLQHSRIFKIR